MGFVNILHSPQFLTWWKERMDLQKAQYMINELRARENLINEMPAIHVEDAQQVSDTFLTSIPSFPFINEWDISQQDDQPQPGPIMPDGDFVCPEAPPPLDYSPYTPNTLSLVSQPEKDQLSKYESLCGGWVSSIEDDQPPPQEKLEATTPACLRTACFCPASTSTADRGATTSTL